MLVKSAPDHFLFRGQVLDQHVASLGSRSKWRSSLRVVRFKSCIVYRIRQEWECQMCSLYAEACLFAFFVFRVVASLTGPGGQEFHFPYFFLKFWSIFLIFRQTVLIFFLILTLRVGDSPTWEGPGYATVCFAISSTFSFWIADPTLHVNLLMQSRLSSGGLHWGEQSLHFSCTNASIEQVKGQAAIWLSTFAPSSHMWNLTKQFLLLESYTSTAQWQKHPI